jgi:hypothetical protein
MGQSISSALKSLDRGCGKIASADFAGIGSRYEFQCSQPQWGTEQICTTMAALDAHLASYLIPTAGEPAL